jgi:predicted nucleotidyltransferase component of viral defense system
MAKNNYKNQVKLLLEILPFVAKETCFAIKGGTAINLFVRDFPRLSVDIDLTYLGDESRDQALKLVEASLHRIKKDIESKIKNVKINPSKKQDQENEMKLFITRGTYQIKIEANPVIRGTLLPAKIRPVVKKVIDEFELEAEGLIVSLGDLYGGKLVAALDRQHPRDLFDVNLLFENEGLTKEIKAGFITYLISQGRPFHEVLKPTLLDQSSIFDSEFEGMSELPFTYKDFETTRNILINEINSSLTQSDRNLLVSITQGMPDWSLFTHGHISDLPAIKWKLMNIEKMKSSKRDEMVKLLKNIWKTV